MWICLRVPIGEIAASLALCVMGSQVAAVNRVPGSVSMGSCCSMLSFMTLLMALFGEWFWKLEEHIEPRLPAGMAVWVYAGSFVRVRSPLPAVVFCRHSSWPSLCASIKALRGGRPDYL